MLAVKSVYLPFNRQHGYFDVFLHLGDQVLIDAEFDAILLEIVLKLWERDLVPMLVQPVVGRVLLDGVVGEMHVEVLVVQIVVV